MFIILSYVFTILSPMFTILSYVFIILSPMFIIPFYVFLKPNSCIFKPYFLLIRYLKRCKQEILSNTKTKTLKNTVYIFRAYGLLKIHIKP